MTATVFDKTDKGREEIATRAHHLAPRQRTLLLLVDGKRDAADLMAKVAGLGLDEKALVELIEGGFVQVNEAPAEASHAPARMAPAAPGTDAATDATVPASTASADSDPAFTPPEPLLPAQRPEGSSAADRGSVAIASGVLREGETQYQALSNFFNETIRSTIGLRGFALQLKVERAATIDDFRALRQVYLDAVLKAKGPELEHSLRNRLDQLLNLAPQ